jgi:D-aminopeptidase
MRSRLRDLGITIGTMPTGKDNAITDVPGIWVGHVTLIHDEPHVARTGLTVVVPREGAIVDDYAFAGVHTFNGCGEVTGLLWLEESGLLSSPIALTTTSQVGFVRDTLTEYAVARYEGRGFWLSVVGETWDGLLNELGVRHLTREHVFAAMDDARPGPVAEGNVGGGTGMICYDFKGGIGTSSRVVDSKSGQYTVGALVQTNHGNRHQLLVDGVPVGREIDRARVPSPWEQSPWGNSILVVIATDAPLLPMQCRRLAQRAAVGLARTGGVGHNTSGDFFLAFATGNHVPPWASAPIDLKMISNQHLDPFFEAVAEAVEEAILNSLTAAETMTGFEGRVAHALPLDELQRVMAMYRRRPVEDK